MKYTLNQARAPCGTLRSSRWCSNTGTEALRALSRNSTSGAFNCHNPLSFSLNPAYLRGNCKQIIVLQEDPRLYVIKRWKHRGFIPNRTDQSRCHRRAATRSSSRLYRRLGSLRKSSWTRSPKSGQKRGEKPKPCSKVAAKGGEFQGDSILAAVCFICASILSCYLFAKFNISPRLV